MEKQNVTLSLSKELLLKVKLLAVRRGTSISGLMTRLLEEVVNQDDGYSAAWKRHRQLMENSQDLGTQGEITWKREELHDR